MKLTQANFNTLRQNLTNLFQADSENSNRNLSLDDNIGESPHFSSSTLLGIQQTQETKEELIKSIKYSHFEVRNFHFNLQYELGRTLGEGAHAVVKLCWPRGLNTQQLFAVKITRSGDYEIMENMRLTFLNTISLSHPYIIKHFKLFIDQNEEIAYMLMDYCPFPSLQKILKEKATISEPQAQRIFKSLIQAVQYIHSKGVSHRDIKPDNILVDKETLTVRLTDFGVSKRFKYSKPGKLQWHEISMWTVTGNIYYCAPEIFHSIGYNKSVDIWSVGVVLYQSLCGQLPYSQEKIMEFFDSIGNEQDKSHFESNCFKQLSPLCQDLIKRLIKIDSTKRLTAKNALLHPWFYSVEMKDKSQRIVQDDTQIKRSGQEGLVSSDQFGIFSRENITQSMIQVEDEVITNNKSEKQQQKIKSFKENNELENIHLVMKDSTHITKIDFISSYHSMTFQSVNIKNHNTDQQKLNQVEKMLSTDPFFANNNKMMICDSEEKFDEESLQQLSSKELLSYNGDEKLVEFLQ